jgi:hypothetical protein
MRYAAPRERLGIVANGEPSAWPDPDGEVRGVTVAPRTKPFRKSPGSTALGLNRSAMLPINLIATTPAASPLASSSYTIA